MRWPSLALLAASLALGAGAACATPALAQAPGTAPQAPGPAWIVGQAAELALLDKVTARTRTETVAVGGSVRFGTLDISVARCLRRPPEEPAEAAAWIAVRDTSPQAHAQAGFSGWMFATSPALNPLQHPVYDVRVLACR